MANKFKKALDTRSVMLEKVDKEADNNKILDDKEKENSINESVSDKKSEKNIQRETENLEISTIQNDNNIDVNHKEEITNEHIKNENELNKETMTKRSKKVSKGKSTVNDKIPDILAELGIEGKKEYKNKTYYLSVKVVDEISRIAKLKGMSESKLINDLLEKILFY